MKTIKYKTPFNLVRQFFVLAIICVLPYTSISGPALHDILAMDLVVHIIDVGVGDAILIEVNDSDQDVLIDGGDRRKGYDIIKYLGSYVDGPIDLGIITHPDYDHWSGMEKVLDNGFIIKELWDPGYGRDCKFRGSNAETKKNRDTYLKFIRSLPRSGMNTLLRPVSSNPTTPLVTLDGVEFKVLYASEAPMGNECSYIINNASIVVRMQYKDIVFLFTGDINGKERKERSNVSPSYVEAKLLELNEIHPDLLKADVLKVPHHGSQTANTRAFIKAVQPRFAVISSSNTSHYTLPKKRVLQQYGRIRFKNKDKIEKVLYTNYGEPNYEKRKFGDDHILCGTNGDKNDLICDYVWNFEE